MPNNGIEVTLLDDQGRFVFPRALASGVAMSNGKTLEKSLEDIEKLIGDLLGDAEIDFVQTINGMEPDPETGNIDIDFISMKPDTAGTADNALALNGKSADEFMLKSENGNFTANAIVVTDWNLATNNGIYYSLNATENVPDVNKTFIGTVEGFDDGATLVQTLLSITDGKWYRRYRRDNVWSMFLELIGDKPLNTFARLDNSTKAEGQFYTGNVEPTGTTRLNYDGNLHATRVFGSVWNDYAEYRLAGEEIEPGYLVEESDDRYSELVQTTNKRLSKKVVGIVSDTYGFCIGQSKSDEGFPVPIALTGRVLVHVYGGSTSHLEKGDCVCSAPGGTVDKMTEEEIRLYPDRIVGKVSGFPQYNYWNNGTIEVKGRIWITIK